MLTQAHLSFMNVKVAQSCLTFCDPMDCSIPGFSVLRILQARILEWVAIPFSRGSSQPRDQTQVSCTEGDSLPSEPPGKPKNAGVGSLSLLQEISMTQELNWGHGTASQADSLPNSSKRQGQKLISTPLTYLSTYIVIGVHSH